MEPDLILPDVPKPPKGFVPPTMNLEETPSSGVKKAPKLPGLPTPPVGRINVMSPKGEIQHATPEWLLKDGIKQGYSLPQNPSRVPSKEDLTPEGELKVINPETGDLATVSHEWYQKSPDAKNWHLQSKVNIDELKEDSIRAKYVQDKLSQKDPTVLATLGGKKENVQDKDGNYKLIAPTGERILVSQKDLPVLLASETGFRFEDRDFQALYNAHIKLGKEEGLSKKSIEAGGAGYVGSLPGFDWLRNKATENTDAMFGKAWNIANRTLEQTTQAKAHGVGTGLGIAAQVLSPTGVFGEMKAAQAARAGIIGAIAPEGANFARLAAARTVAGLAEGAIISSPQVLAKVALEKDLKGAAENLALGAGLGGLLGVTSAALTGGGKLANAGASFFKEGAATKALEAGGASAETLASLAPQKNIESIGKFVTAGGALGEKTAMERLFQHAIENPPPPGVAKSINPLGNFIKGIPEGVKGEALQAALDKQGITSEKIAEVAGVLNQKEPFIQTLIEKGLSRKSTPEQVEQILKDVSFGQNVKELAEKLDKLAAEPFKASGLQGKIAKINIGEAAQQALFADKATANTVTNIYNRFNELVDKSGNIKIANLQKFVEETGNSINWRGKADDVVNNIKKQVLQDAQATLIEAGDKAALKGADARLATKWAEGKTILTSAQQMHSQTVDNIISGAFKVEGNPVVKLILDKVSKPVAGTIGSLVGGPAHGFISYKGAEGIAAYGNYLLQKYVENPSNVSKLKTWLSGNKVSNAIGSYLALDALKVAQQKVDAISPYLKAISQRSEKALPMFFSSSAEPLKEILGKEGSGLSKQEQIKKLAEKTSRLVGSTDAFNGHMTSMLDNIIANHPQLAEQMKQDTMNKLQVINSILKSRSFQEPKMFEKQGKSSISNADIQKIEDQLKVVNNPYALLEGIKNGKVSQKQVQIVQQLYPDTLQKIRTALTNEGYSGNTNLTYQQRLSISTIMNTQADPSLKNIKTLQSTYESSQSAPPQQQGKGKKSGGGGKSPNTHAAKISNYTAAQRITK